MRIKIIIVVNICFLINSVYLADAKKLSCYDLLHRLNSDEEFDQYGALNYLSGVLDGIGVTQYSFTISEKNLQHMVINIPKGGIQGGQLELIYKKWAKNHPEDLHFPASACIYNALVETFGWRNP
jgi:hypothetical protein